MRLEYADWTIAPAQPPTQLSDSNPAILATPFHPKGVTMVTSTELMRPVATHPLPDEGLATVPLTYEPQARVTSHRAMRLADFILTNRAAILAEWEAFAESCAPASGSLGIARLSDHASE